MMVVLSPVANISCIFRTGTSSISISNITEIRGGVHVEQNRQRFLTGNENGKDAKSEKLSIL